VQVLIGEPPIIFLNVYRTVWCSCYQWQLRENVGHHLQGAPPSAANDTHQDRLAKAFGLQNRQGGNPGRAPMSSALSIYSLKIITLCKLSIVRTLYLAFFFSKSKFHVRKMCWFYIVFFLKSLIPSHWNYNNLKYNCNFIRQNQLSLKLTRYLELY